ncbi:hypothetical protein Tco_0199408 [Tanacetum coccineum]
MAQENYVERCSMQRPPFLEAGGFCFWKTCFETYIKSKDIDLWQVIQNRDFVFEIEDSETKMMKVMPYELLKDNEKIQLGKNNEAKMTFYNALPCKVYERVFICKTAKEVCHTLIITHQGNSQDKDFKIDLITQQYEKFSISGEETIHNGFTRFNAIVISLKSLDQEYSSKSCEEVWKLLLGEAVNEDGGRWGKKEVKAFNLMARNFCKFFQKGNGLGHGNSFGNGANSNTPDYLQLLYCKNGGVTQDKDEVATFGAKKSIHLNAKSLGEQGFIEGAWNDSDDGKKEPQNDANMVSWLSIPRGFALMVFYNGTIGF